MKNIFGVGGNTVRQVNQAMDVIGCPGCAGSKVGVHGVYGMAQQVGSNHVGLKETLHGIGLIVRSDLGPQVQVRFGPGFG